MRFALILAFICSVAFPIETADARPGGVASAQARKPPKAHKRRAKAKKRSKHTKASRKARVKAREVAVADDADTPDPAPTVDALPPVRRAPVAQATDDEEPPRGPAKRR